jgi:alkanesulfonate monooxygenase SsuD/methylene tetrahydromethanopterin reductase-like flavin-dependent oxidoreductase (luciferase family)
LSNPNPAQKPHPPLLFGGWSNNRILRLAAKMGDGWTPTGPRSGEAVKSPADYGRFVSEIEKGRNAAGRASKEFAYGCRFGPLDDPQEYLREIESYKPAGLNSYQLGVNVRKHSTEVIRKFGDTVIATS